MKDFKKRIEELDKEGLEIDSKEIIKMFLGGKYAKLV